MNYAEEGIGQLFAGGCDGAVDFEMTEHPLNAVALQDCDLVNFLKMEAPKGR